MRKERKENPCDYGNFFAEFATSFASFAVIF